MWLSVFISYRSITKINTRVNEVNKIIRYVSPLEQSLLSIEIKVSEIISSVLNYSETHDESIFAYLKTLNQDFESFEQGLNALGLNERQRIDLDLLITHYDEFRESADEIVLIEKKILSELRNVIGHIRKGAYYANEIENYALQNDFQQLLIDLENYLVIQRDYTQTSIHDRIEKINNAGANDLFIGLFGRELTTSSEMIVLLIKKKSSLTSWFNHDLKAIEAILAEDILPFLHKSVNEAESKLKLTGSNAEIHIISVLILSLVIFIVFLYILTNNFTEPLKKLESYAKSIRENQDLGIEINLEKNDEFGVLGNSLNDMRLSLLEREKAVKEAMQLALEEKDRAYEANKSKSQFLANMSHEIRTPLNSVIGYSDMMIEDELNHEQRNMMETIKNSSEILLNLVNDILDLAKIEAGEMELEEIPSNIEDILFEVSEALVTKIQNKSLEINVSMNDVYALAVVDPLKLKQVFINLINNAIKFTEKGEVLISVETINEDEKSMTLKFSVRDTGIGIAPEEAINIFEPFKQADGSTTRKYGGTGLGLNITKQILEKMGSSVKLESKVDEGSEFSFQLNLKKHFAEADEVTDDYSSLKDITVLMIDDNQSATDIVANYLKRIGAKYFSSNSTFESLELLKSEKVDLIMMDIIMPNCDAYQTAVKAKEINPDLKIIALTADINPMTLAKVKEKCFDGYLIKPLRASIFYRAVASVNNKTKKKKLITKAELEPKFSPSKLLVVDDNPGNLKLASKILTKMGHKVETAQSGFEAISKSSENYYDIIFMDMQMPEMSGTEATKIIREKKNNTPIIALTANAFESDRKLCLDSGMNDFSTKPFKRKEIHELIQKYTTKETPFIEKRLLMIEDDATTAELLKNVIERNFPGIVLRIANTGVQALTLIGSFAPHTIILDFMLPDMDGFRIIEFLKSEEKYKDTKVIVNSSLDSQDERIQKILDLKVSGFVNKGEDTNDKIKLISLLKSAV